MVNWSASETAPKWPPLANLPLSELLFEPEHIPDRPPANAPEKWTIGLFSLIFFGLFTAEIARDFQVAKLSLPFFLISWVILLVVHEFGHALMARALGWEVDLISLGSGKIRRRLRVLGMDVEIRTIPLSGFVRPRPLDHISPHLKNFLIYAAGPGIEILLVLIIALTLGFSTLLQRSESIALIATQSFCLAALFGAIFNLIPFPHRNNDGSQSWSDGLGMILCWTIPDSHYGEQTDAEDS